MTIGKFFYKLIIICVKVESTFSLFFCLGIGKKTNSITIVVVNNQKKMNGLDNFNPDCGHIFQIEK